MQVEYLDVVDENDIVVGMASRDEIYQKQLPHRIVHILLFDEVGNMWLQKRSPHVSYCPDHWSTAVGGHVRSGETPEVAALREFKEELGLHSPLSYLAKDYYEAIGSPNKFLITYTATHVGPFHLEERAVASISAFPLDEIETMVNAQEKFHPELLFLLEKYYFES